MTRTVPLNCGMSKSTIALPSASSFTAPEKKATSFSVGGLPCAVKRGAVAAGAQFSGDAERTVDQAAVEVADFKAEPALAVIARLRIWHLVVGQVEDADIDRGDRHIGVGRRRNASHGNRDRQRLVRFRSWRPATGLRRACARRDRSSAISSRWRAPACAIPARRRDGTGLP